MWIMIMKTVFIWCWMPILNRLTRHCCWGPMPGFVYLPNIRIMVGILSAALLMGRGMFLKTTIFRNIIQWIPVLHLVPSPYTMEVLSQFIVSVSR